VTGSDIHRRATTVTFCLCRRSPSARRDREIEEDSPSTQRAAGTVQQQPSVPSMIHGVHGQAFQAAGIRLPLPRRVDAVVRLPSARNSATTTPPPKLDMTTADLSASAIDSLAELAADAERRSIHCSSQAEQVGRMGRVMRHAKHSSGWPDHSQCAAQWGGGKQVSWRSKKNWGGGGRSPHFSFAH